ncbi:related to tRNA dihydrouridine synthase [Rhynchosporium secalis]|uniref:tRNA-dihydrouridine(16/17) synthase [NAD(P)(+)] n=1 Tax=Rhynchosporium secalis TaxID=38038 RepID=A0A1E1MN02_RHYSE|nr:related to tRNA dihydrouridine synthase [Rhynchosporium secalis]
MTAGDNMVEGCLLKKGEGMVRGSGEGGLLKKGGDMVRGSGDTILRNKKEKLHGRAFYESIGGPKFVLAPMVDQSEFAWRMLSRSFIHPSSQRDLVAYTPMLHARMFSETSKFRDSHFQPLRSSLSSPLPPSPLPPVYLDGNPSIDRPLFVQFCANSPTDLLSAARYVAPFCDAVDLNLGCPQGIARKGKYGAFLQEDPDLIYALINTLHKELDVPVTAKIRILETKEKTLQYAKKVLSAGASILTVHGRTREMKGHKTGLADWSVIRYLREQLPKETVLFANGNVLRKEDIEECLEMTGADGVMSAEGNLYDPAIFSEAPKVGEEGREFWRGVDGRGGWRMDAVMRRYMDIIYRFVLEVEPPVREPLFLPSDSERTAGAISLSSLVTGTELHSQNSNGTATTKRKLNSAPLGGCDEPQSPASKRYKIIPPPTNPPHSAPNSNSALQSECESPQTKTDLKPQKNKARAAKTTSPNLLAMQPHLFKLLRPLVAKHHNVRDALARSRAGDIEAFENVLKLVETACKIGLTEYHATGGSSWEAEMEEDLAAQKAKVKSADVKVKEGEEIGEMDESSIETVRACKRPWWVVQPYVRPLPKEALAKGSLTLSKKEREALRRTGDPFVDLEKIEGKGGHMDVERVGEAEGQGKGEGEKVEIPKDGLVCG